MDQGVSPGRVVFLMGPTASGKTDLAVKLAASGPFDVISVDSALIYRGMDIGTAKPDAATLAQTPHQLIDIRDPAEAYSAAEFAQDARVAIAASFARQRIPLLVGGTFLYYSALQHGLSPLPPSDPDIRRELTDELVRSGPAALHARLARVDPVAAERIKPGDRQRILRALEVHRQTGRSLTELCRGGRTQALAWPLTKLALLPPGRDWLRARIAERFGQMLDAGFEAEVRHLMKRADLHPELPSMRAVGYRQMWQYLEGRMGEAEMIERGIIATGQYAKRQLTWLRREADATVLPGGSPSVFDELVRKLSIDGIRW